MNGEEASDKAYETHVRLILLAVHFGHEIDCHHDRKASFVRKSQGDSIRWTKCRVDSGDPSSMVSTLRTAARCLRNAVHVHRVRPRNLRSCEAGDLDFLPRQHKSPRTEERFRHHGRIAVLGQHTVLTRNLCNDCDLDQSSLLDIRERIVLPAA